MTYSLFQLQGLTMRVEHTGLHKSLLKFLRNENCEYVLDAVGKTDEHISRIPGMRGTGVRLGQWKSFLAQYGLYTGMQDLPAIEDLQAQLAVLEKASEDVHVNFMRAVASAETKFLTTEFLKLVAHDAAPQVIQEIEDCIENFPQDITEKVDESAHAIALEVLQEVGKLPCDTDGEAVFINESTRERLIDIYAASVARVQANLVSEHHPTASERIKTRLNPFARGPE